MMPILTSRLRLRNWQGPDHELFHLINSDDGVMEFFPFRRNRAESDAVLDRISAAIEKDGFGWTAAELVTTGECIGFIGLNVVDLGALAPPGSLEIGWRLAPQYWGKGYVTEAAEALLDFAFDTLGKPEVISFAVWNNDRSIAVMKRLGMAYESDFDHPNVPDTHQHLKRHALYRLPQSEWTKKKSAL